MRKDIDINFRPHPLTGDIVVKKDANAVQQSLMNIVKTAFYERGFNIDFGTGVYNAMFENVSFATTAILEKDIAQSIQNFEPQADLNSVSVIDDGSNTLHVIIVYQFNNKRDPHELSVKLKRVR